MPALGSDHSRDTAACNCSRGNTIKLKKQTNKGKYKVLGKEQESEGMFSKEREYISFHSFSI